MLRIRQLKGHDPQFGLSYALMSDEPFGLVAKVACGDAELYGKGADRAALAWARKLAAVPDLIAALTDAVKQLDGMPYWIEQVMGENSQAIEGVKETCKAAREAIKNAGAA